MFLRLFRFRSFFPSFVLFLILFFILSPPPPPNTRVNVPALYLASEAALTVYEAGRTTGVAVNMGEHSISSIVVYEGNNYLIIIINQQSINSFNCLKRVSGPEFSGTNAVWRRTDGRSYD